jgi:hypothetical protein
MILSHRGALTRERLVGKTIWEVLPADASIRVAGRLGEAMASQQPVAFEEQNALQGQWLAYRAFPTAEGLSVYCHDITEAKNREATLQAMAQAAQGVSQVLDVALSPVAAYFSHQRDRRELPPDERAATDQMAAHLDRAMESVSKLRRAVRASPEQASRPPIQATDSGLRTRPVAARPPSAGAPPAGAARWVSIARRPPGGVDMHASCWSPWPSP